MGLSEHKVEVVIAVSDLDRAGAFYEDQLGLRPGPRQDVRDQGVRYPCSAGAGVFVYLSPDRAGESSVTLAGWFVDDLDETTTDLLSRGVTFEHYDQPGSAPTSVECLTTVDLKPPGSKIPTATPLPLTELST